MRRIAPGHVACARGIESWWWTRRDSPAIPYPLTLSGKPVWRGPSGGVCWTESRRWDPPALDGIDYFIAPRRIVLDKMLVDAAREAGAKIREGCYLD